MMRKTLLLLSLLALVCFSAQASANEIDTEIIARATPTVVFELGVDDILAWDESAKGKYIYFTVTDEKGAEFEEITTNHVGEILAIHLNDEVVMHAVIREKIENKGQLVLSPQDDKRETVLGMLPAEKKGLKIEREQELSVDVNGESNEQE